MKINKSSYSRFTNFAEDVLHFIGVISTMYPKCTGNETKKLQRNNFFLNNRILSLIFFEKCPFGFLLLLFSVSFSRGFWIHTVHNCVEMTLHIYVPAAARGGHTLIARKSYVGPPPESSNLIEFTIRLAGGLYRSYLWRAAAQYLWQWNSRSPWERQP